MMKLIRLNRPSLIIVLLLLILSIGNAVSVKSQSPADRKDAKQVSLAVPKPLGAEILELPKPSIGLPSKPSEKLAVYAKGYIVMDSETKYPLAAKNADTPMPIASTTKIMTALVAIDSFDLEQVVSVSPQAAGIIGSEIQLLTGEKMSVKNLLYALMLNSANDAAYALADGSGSREDFIAKMNAKAALLGLKNTQYHDPAGLDDAGRSTPRDLALLMHYALANQTFRSLISTAEYSITSADNRYVHELSNSNRLIQTDEPLYYQAAIGGKTGFTFEAGHCLVAAAEYSNDVRQVAVILNTVEATNDASAKEARKLLQWAAPKP